MKKFFAFAIAIVAMATSMVSCNNDNTDFIQQPAPAAQTHNNPAADINLVVAVTPAQINYLDETYVVSVGGNEQTVKVSDMAPITADQVRSYNNIGDLSAAFKVDVVYFTYPLGQIKAGQTAKVVSYKADVKANHPAEEFDYVNAAYFTAATALNVISEKPRIEMGVYADAENLTKFTQIVNQNNAGSASVRY